MRRHNNDNARERTFLQICLWNNLSMWTEVENMSGKKERKKAGTISGSLPGVQISTITTVVVVLRL